SNSGVKAEDKRLLLDFGENLGKSDREGEIGNINLYKDLIDINLVKSREEYRKKSRLYKVLGFGAGATIAIIIL
ncbi:MAG: stage III sporulation protein AB, partial [Acutalibacteraceae bacterium]